MDLYSSHEFQMTAMFVLYLLDVLYVCIDSTNWCKIFVIRDLKLQAALEFLCAQ